MKKLVLLVGMMFMVSPLFAETVPVKTWGVVEDHHHAHSHFRKVDTSGTVTVHDKTVDTDTHNTAKDAEDLKLGLKADAPNIVKLTENSSIGVEAGKDMHGTGISDGWFAWLKFTWKGTFFDFSD